MIIIPHVNGPVLPRCIHATLSHALAAMPAVVVAGARHTGKSTLTQAAEFAHDRVYLTLDDMDVLGQARAAPDDLIGRGRRVTIDEVQREPHLVRAVKRAIDLRRTRGRFLLAASANLSSMRQGAESLGGRASHLTLWPLTRREQMGLGRTGIWEELLATPDDEWLDVVQADDTGEADWRTLARHGGLPTAALELSADPERAAWFTGYVRTYLERDLQDLAAIAALPDVRRLMRAACHRLGQMVNQAELGRDVALPQPTVHRYLNLLETSYQLVRVPAFTASRTRRLIKTPKLYWADTGLALHVAELDAPSGAHLENIVLCDLLAWRGARSRPADIFYWRTATGEDVDFVIETGHRLVPIEVKTTARPRLDDARHLRTFRDEYGAKARTALLLHTGDRVEWLAPGILAAPWWKVL